MIDTVRKKETKIDKIKEFRKKRQRFENEFSNQKA